MVKGHNEDITNNIDKLTNEQKILLNIQFSSTTVTCLEILSIMLPLINYFVFLQNSPQAIFYVSVI